MYQKAYKLVFKFERWSIWSNYLFYHVFIWENMVAETHEETSGKLILSFVISTKDKCFCVWIMIHRTCKQINTSSGPQCSHRFILQFTVICHSIVNLQNSFFGVIYICLKLYNWNKLLVFSWKKWTPYKKCHSCHIKDHIKMTWWKSKC